MRLRYEFLRLDRLFPLARVALFALSTAAFSLDCGSASAIRPTPPSAPGAHCKVSASHDRPLIVEWAATDRADLETMVRQGKMVVVKYTGCELELLRDCQLDGKYKFVGSSRQQERITIRDQDELWAKMPIGAASLEGQLARGTGLSLDLSVVGKYVGDLSSIKAERLDSSACRSATHIISGLTAGAFQMSTESSAQVGGGAGVVGAKSSSSESVLRGAGSVAACAQARAASETPPDDCGALLRLELTQVCPSSGTIGANCSDAASAAAGDRAPLDLGNNPLDEPAGNLVYKAAQAVGDVALGAPPPDGIVVEIKEDNLPDRKYAFKRLGTTRPEIVLAAFTLWAKRKEPLSVKNVTRGTFFDWSRMKIPLARDTQERDMFATFGDEDKKDRSKQWMRVTAVLSVDKHRRVRWLGVMPEYDDKTEGEEHLNAAYASALTRVREEIAPGKCKLTPNFSGRDATALALPAEVKSYFERELPPAAAEIPRVCEKAREWTGQWEVANRFTFRALYSGKNKLFRVLGASAKATDSGVKVEFPVFTNSTSEDKAPRDRPQAPAIAPD